MKKIVLILVLAVSTHLLYSQTVFRADSVVVNNEVMGKLTIENYPHIALYKGEKCNFSDSTAEYKFCNFFNIQTEEELKSFFSPYGIPSSYNNKDYLDKMKIYDQKNNFYSLDSKYILDNGVSKDIFIKYVNYNEKFPKPIYSVFYIQDFSNNLIVKDMGENFDFGLFLIGSNTNKTINYFKNVKVKEINITSLCSDFLETMKNSSNKNNLHDIIDKKYSPFFNDKDESTLNENTTPDFTYTYKKTFHDIVNGEVLEKNKISKKEISDTYRIPIEYLTEDSLTVKDIINVNTINNNFTIIKFFESNPVIKTDFEILNNVIIQYNNLLFVLTKLDFEFFVNLCFDKDNKKFPELQKLRLLVKDADGVLNIFKLAKVIEENKSLLSNYIEE